MARYLSLLVTLFSAVADASVIEVRSTATVNPGGPMLVSDREGISENFVVLITGGSGNGYYSPSLSLSGITNESSNEFAALGASAAVNWPVSMQAGDPFGSAAISSPAINCPRHSDCWIAFTFGVPQAVHFAASTYAVLDMTSRLPVTSPVTVTSSVTFDGIGSIIDGRGQALDAKVQITFAPEPNTAGLISIVFVLAVVQLKRRRC